MRHFRFWWIGLLLGAMLIFITGYFVGKTTSPHATLTNAVIQPPAIQAQLPINKSFQFPVQDASSQTSTMISYTVVDATKQNQVIIQGQRAYAVSGKTFLILTIKLTNTSDKTVAINTRDYIRLSTGKSSELLAADMYSDPVVVQPISTESTKIGFPIDTETKTLTLHVGQLTGSKTTIPLTFSH